jgi:hypothetical protein
MFIIFFSFDNEVRLLVPNEWVVGTETGQGQSDKITGPAKSLYRSDPINHLCGLIAAAFHGPGMTSIKRSAISSLM